MKLDNGFEANFDEDILYIHRLDFDFSVALSFNSSELYEFAQHLDDCYNKITTIENDEIKLSKKYDKSEDFYFKLNDIGIITQVEIYKDKDNPKGISNSSRIVIEINSLIIVVTIGINLFREFAKFVLNRALEQTEFWRIK